MKILPPNQDSVSIFDSIRHLDEQDSEFWLARELMPLLGYAKWQKFEDAILRAQFACQNSGACIDGHFEYLPGGVSIGKRGQAGANFKLSRYASYLVAMNGDSRKSEIAQAQTYFALKTREAETIIPVQSEALRLAELRIKELEIQLGIATANKEANQAVLRARELDNTMLTLHGAPTVLALRGMSDQVVEIEKPTIEVIDEKSGAQFKGMTLAKLNEFVSKKHGVKHKSGAEIARFLDQKGYGHLIGQVPRRQLTDYIPEENIAEVIRVLISDHRQLILGE